MSKKTLILALLLLEVNTTSIIQGLKAIKKAFSRLHIITTIKRAIILRFIMNSKKQYLKKLALVLATSILMTGVGKEVVLQRMSCICYLIQF